MKFTDLIGKTVASTTLMKLPKYDDVPYLKLVFTDGEHCFISATQGPYTGGSIDEYPEIIQIEKDVIGIVEAEEKQK